MILRVKKAQKVGYSLSGSSTSFKLALYTLANVEKMGRRRSLGICISAIISVCLQMAGLSLSFHRPESTRL